MIQKGSELQIRLHMQIMLNTTDNHACITQVQLLQLWKITAPQLFYII